MNTRYLQQAKLMLEMIPFIMREKVFALKGGTAINFFIQDIPRLSVDIDLVYLPIKNREISLQEISDSLLRCEKYIQEQGAEYSIQDKRISGNYCISLWVTRNDVVIKIEANTILRGSVYPPENREVSSAVSTKLNLELFTIAQTLSVPDIYAGKLVAALDRQHPRDIFDVRILFKQSGITDQIQRAFIVYLISHNRPIHELLAPNAVDMRPAFENEFEGMTMEPVTLEDLETTRTALFQMIPGILSDGDKQFLISFKKCEPDWSLLDLKTVEQLPAVQWKLLNIKKMDREKHLTALRNLEKALTL